MTQKTGTRWVVLDDDDEALEYTGNWFEEENDFADLGIYGPTYGGSQHGTNNTGVMAFSFIGALLHHILLTFSDTPQGSKAKILGTSFGFILAESGERDPTWTCIGDGVTVPHQDPWAVAINCLTLCSFDFTADPGPHTVSVSAVSPSVTFYVDSVEYLAAPETQRHVGRQTVFIDEVDPATRWDGWVRYQNRTMMTTRPGAKMSVSFNGEYCIEVLCFLCC